jgi:hypothetical protein
VGHVVHSGASGAQNADALFSCSGQTCTDSTTSALGHITPNTCFCIWCDLQVKLCIPVRPRRKISTHYFSCSGGPGAASIKSPLGHITLNLCFWIRWDLLVTLCIPVYEMLTHYFSCLGGRAAVSMKSALGQVSSNIYASGGTCGSRSFHT